MNARLFFRSFFLMVFLIGMLASANALILADENFEGTPFVDRDWLIEAGGQNVGTEPGVEPTQAIIAEQGVNLSRYNVNAVKNQVPTFTGQVVSERFFDGAKSLRLQSGQICKITQNGTRLVGATVGGFKIWQFAVSANAASAALAAGTQVGYFKVDFELTTSTVTNDPDYTLLLKLVAAGSGKMNLVLDETGAVIGTLTGAAGDWRVVTIMESRAATEKPWMAYDPLTTTFKGPQPVVPNPLSTANPDAPANFQSFARGFNIFVDSNAPAAFLPPSQTDMRFETDQSADVEWEFGATNGGTIYIDDYFWSYGGFDSIVNGLRREQGARMNAFNAASTETGAAPEASAKTWSLY